MNPSRSTSSQTPRSSSHFHTVTAGKTSARFADVCSVGRLFGLLGRLFGLLGRLFGLLGRLYGLPGKLYGLPGCGLLARIGSLRVTVNSAVTRAAGKCCGIENNPGLGPSSGRIEREGISDAPSPVRVTVTGRGHAGALRGHTNAIRQHAGAVGKGIAIQNKQGVGPSFGRIERVGISDAPSPVRVTVTGRVHAAAFFMASPPRCAQPSSELVSLSFPCFCVPLASRSLLFPRLCTCRQFTHLPRPLLGMRRRLSGERLFPGTYSVRSDCSSESRLKYSNRPPP